MSVVQPVQNGRGDWRTRNLAELFVCECGSPVGKEDIDGKVNAIQCKKSDCETKWVSKSSCCTVL